MRAPPPGFLISVTSQMFALTIAALFGAHMLARPIQRLGRAAAGLGTDLTRPLPGRGIAWRLENSRNRSTGGVGLGLASAREAATQCGGTLTLENVPGGLLARLAIKRTG